MYPNDDGFGGGVTEISARRSATRDRLVEPRWAFSPRRASWGVRRGDLGGRRIHPGAFYSNFESKDECAWRRWTGSSPRAGRDEGRDRIPGGGAAPDLGRAGAARYQAFLEAQPSDRVSVLAGAELQLYAAREESFAGPYAAHAAGTGLTFARIIEDAAAQFGQRLAVPAEEAIGVLATVYISSALNALIAGPDASVDVSSVLSAVLASMLRPA